MDVLVRPKNKKSFIQVEMYEKDGKSIRVETVFRSGVFLVNEDLLPEDTDEDLDLNELDGELDSYFDVCEVEIDSMDMDEEYEKFVDLYEEDNWLVEDELGWELTSTDYYIEGGFEIEED
jgi:hypothetical protein